MPCFLTPKYASRSRPTTPRCAKNREGPARSRHMTRGASARVNQFETGSRRITPHPRDIEKAIRKFPTRSRDISRQSQGEIRAAHRDT